MKAKSGEEQRTLLDADVRLLRQLLESDRDPNRNCFHFELPGLAISKVFAGPEELAAFFRSLYSENMAVASSSRCNFL
jgi:hypothetical protein